MKNLKINEQNSFRLLSCMYAHKKCTIMKFRENLAKKEVELEDQHIFNLPVWIVSFYWSTSVRRSVHT